MAHRILRRLLLSTGIALAAGSGAANAQSLGGNLLFLIQEGAGGSTGGNTLTLDQSNALGTRLAGSEDGLLPALQSGGGNTADVLMEGADGRLSLSQVNTGGALGRGNEAFAVIGGASIGELIQSGQGNVADLTIFSVPGLLPGSGRIEQEGSSNIASLRVEGAGASGQISQMGDANIMTLEVEGAGTSGTVIQTGNGNGTTGTVRVISNGETVRIVQRGF
ncbi:hypothetical protein [Profundibacterium mesophilum]|uniref:Curlin associated repeat-containing protein n=1 Tax=Profundibacterium mesophilum KAUST100406-0324 TaxID=1037889 RepID=A0A921TBQ5_9RHOB|nr:hypothetical protein [Profundibacterium mesophilum]KAF0676065.1 Curlin associated repeat-containing protein [Profundibacterium mesophilum KAUST100406-0324]